MLYNSTKHLDILKSVVLIMKQLVQYDWDTVVDIIHLIHCGKRESKTYFRWAMSIRKLIFLVTLMFQSAKYTSSHVITIPDPLV